MGFGFWFPLLESGAVSLSTFVLDLLEGVKAAIPDDATPDFRAQKEADAAYLADKKDLGVYAGILKGLGDLELASEIMDTFDGSAEGLQAAIDKVDDTYSKHVIGGDDPIVQLIGVVDNPFDVFS